MSGWGRLPSQLPSWLPEPQRNATKQTRACRAGSKMQRMDTTKSQDMSKPAGRGSSRLTPQELESLRQEDAQSSAWAKAELAKGETAVPGDSLARNARTRLSPEELESLREDAAQASAWAKAELSKA